MVRKIFISATALLLAMAAYAQGEQLVDSTFNRYKLDQDSLYYDEMAYLEEPYVPHAQYGFR